MTDWQSAPLVVATFGRRFRLMIDDGCHVSARLKGRRLKPVCGDRVEAAQLQDEDSWLITAICPRKNELTRPDRRGRSEVLAANLTEVAVVVSELPVPDWFLVDRYLAAAENMQADALVIFNKADLGAPSAAAQAELDEYRRIGYTMLLCSAAAGPGTQLLADELRSQTAIFAGQSGVGKSSLINRLTGADSLPTGEVSGSTGEGRHTTVNSVLLALPGGGAVIDSPGVRDYAPVLRTANEVIGGFREIALLADDCRFANCRHLREPDCAVKAAVDARDISSRRYESYKRLLALTKELEKRLR